MVTKGITEFVETPGAVRDSVGLATIIFKFMEGMGNILLSPAPNYSQYNRCILHLQSLLEPYADEKYHTEKSVLHFRLERKMRSQRSSMRKQAELEYYEETKAIIFRLIRRLGIGLQETDTEVI